MKKLFTILIVVLVSLASSVPALATGDAYAMIEIEDAMERLHKSEGYTQFFDFETGYTKFVFYDLISVFVESSASIDNMDRSNYRWFVSCFWQDFQEIAEEFEASDVTLFITKDGEHIYLASINGVLNLKTNTMYPHIKKE